MARAPDLDRSLESLRDELAGVMELIERGQAASPLAEALARAAAPCALPVLVAATAPEGRGRLLSWLAGDATGALGAAIPEAAAVAVDFGPRGYEIDAGGVRLHPGSLGELTSALGGLSWRGAGEAVVTMRFESAAVLGGLRLRSPSHLPFDTSEGLRALADGQSVLILGFDHEAGGVAIAPFSAMIHSAALVAPVALTGPGVTAGPAGFAEASLLPAVSVSAGAASLLSRLESGPLRDAIDRLRTLRRFASLAAAARERIDTDIRQLDARRLREQMLERGRDPAREDADARLVFERARQLVTEETARLLAAVRETSRRATLKGGHLRLLADELTGAVQPADIERRKAGRVFQLSLSPDVLKHMQTRMERAVRRQIEEDCILLRDGLDLVRRSVEGELGALNATNPGFPMAAPQAQEVWGHLENMLEVDLRYRGEMPKKGFLASLGEGRRVVFLILMVGTLVGGFLGFNLRDAAWVGLLLLVLFFLTAAFAVFGWRRDDAQLLDKEIFRIRDQLDATLERLTDGLMREKLARYQTLIDESRRAGLQRLDGIARETQSLRASGSEEEKRASRARLKMLDVRRAEIVSLSSRLARSEAQLAGTQAEALSEMRKVIGALGGAG